MWHKHIFTKNNDIIIVVMSGIMLKWLPRIIIWLNFECKTGYFDSVTPVLLTPQWKMNSRECTLHVAHPWNWPLSAKVHFNTAVLFVGVCGTAMTNNNWRHQTFTWISLVFWFYFFKQEPLVSSIHPFPFRWRIHDIFTMMVWECGLPPQQISATHWQ